MTDYDTGLISSQPTPSAKLTESLRQTGAILDTAMTTYLTQSAALQATLAQVMALMRIGEDITSAQKAAPFTHDTSGVLLNFQFASSHAGAWQPWPAKAMVWGAHRTIYSTELASLQGVGVPIVGVTLTGS